MKKNAERRRYPRIEEVLSITLERAPFSQTTETKNISASGAYCRVSKPVPEMTRFDLTLWVPVPGTSGATTHEIRCSGVVVRTEKIRQENGGKEKHYIAIFFDRIRPEDRRKLVQYVKDQRKKKGLA